MDQSQSRPLVAVVEDHAASRTAMGRLLRAAGFETVLFESAEAHIEASPAPVCIIVDVYLPGISGLELQQRLRAGGHAPPIIVTTSSRETAVRERAQQNGCTAFFYKPVDRDSLTATITSLANR